ncbi:MAG: hypothetical protein K2I28_01705 [Muribaculaceae bacterium]|nr:hypothetical protein [Muribaculaceae bacterium]
MKKFAISFTSYFITVFIMAIMIFLITDMTGIRDKHDWLYYATIGICAAAAVYIQPKISDYITRKLKK